MPSARYQGRATGEYATDLGEQTKLRPEPSGKGPALGEISMKLVKLHLNHQTHRDVRRVTKTANRGVRSATEYNFSIIAHGWAAMDKNVRYDNEYNLWRKVKRSKVAEKTIADTRPR